MIAKFLPTILGLTSAIQAAPASRIPTAIGSKPSTAMGESDWEGIRSAHSAWQHRFQEIAGGWQAHNPGQQWTTTFDGRGFLTKPQDRGWSWGLQLKSYGFEADPQMLGGTPEIKASGQRLSYHWQGGLEEWFVNDGRGLEHGYIVAERPSGPRPDEPLAFTLATLGGLRPKAADDTRGVHFLNESGALVLTYDGLKVWDAKGKTLASWFAQGENGEFRLLVEESGASYPITIDPLAQQAYLKASNPGADDFFGTSVAVFGDTVVVGAPGENSSTTGVNSTPNNLSRGAGAVYVFVRSGAGWIQQAYLKAFNTSIDNEFGYSVAISGDTVVVGAPLEDSSTPGVNSTPDYRSRAVGAAYVFSRSGGVWTQQAYLKASNTGPHYKFGCSVAISENTVVVGAFGESRGSYGGSYSPTEDPEDAGAAYVFVRIGETWTQQAHLTAFNADPMDEFGRSVAISGDTVVVGARSEDSNSSGINSTPNNGSEDSGAAYIFVRSGGAWTLQAYLKASNSGAFDQFGGSVAISGETLVVGAPLEDSSTTGVNSNPNDSANAAGAAYVFLRNGGAWTQQVYLKAGVIEVGSAFGAGLAISGDTLAVGTQYAVEESGWVYVFVRNLGAWAQHAYFKGLNTQSGDRFGSSVAISAEALVVGAPYERSITPGVNGTPDYNAAGANAGAAYIFSFLPEIAVQQPAGTNLTDGVGGIAFGSGVVNASGATKTFTIRNAGTADLTGLSISKTGSHAADFVVSAPSNTPLEPGATRSFTVTFKPSANGPRGATLMIASNDADENPFRINLSGTGAPPAPEIAVEQPKGSNLTDGKSKKTFGTVKRGGQGVARTFTIRNTGTANLTNLAVSLEGANPKDFAITQPLAKSLKPGTSTTFKVTFKPLGTGNRTALLRIRSNDKNENPFDIPVAGFGAR
jgi:hypothetical protein